MGVYQNHDIKVQEKTWTGFDPREQHYVLELGSTQYAVMVYSMRETLKDSTSKRNFIKPAGFLGGPSGGGKDQGGGEPYRSEG